MKKKPVDGITNMHSFNAKIENQQTEKGSL